MLDFNNLPAKDKLYYLEDGIAIYCADCRDILPLIPDKSIDLVLTSPPYFNERKYTQYQDFEHYHFTIYDIMRQLFRSICNFGTVVWNVSQIISSRDMAYDLGSYSSMWLLESGFNFFKKIIWRKAGYVSHSFRLAILNPYVSFYLPEACHEELIIYTKGNLNGNRKRRTPLDLLLAQKFNGDVWDIPQVNYGTPQWSEHPAPFPNQLASNCISFFNESDGIILDPFLGSGTTAYCAKKLSRKCIGIEIEEKYCQIAKKRLSQSVMKFDI